MKKNLILNVCVGVFLVLGLFYYQANKKIEVDIEPVEMVDYNGAILFVEEALLDNEPISTSETFTTKLKLNKKYSLIWKVANKNKLGMFLNEETYRKDIIITKKDNVSTIIFGGKGKVEMLTLEEHIEYINARIKELQEKNSNY